MKMSTAEVTENEVEMAETLSAQREFGASLALLQELLHRARDGQIRMRLLFDVVTCSTWLKLTDVRDTAMRELKQYPDDEVSVVFANMVQAKAFIESGQAQEALDLVNANLRSEVMEREDFKDWKYEHLFLKGRSLTQLGNCVEALSALDEAHTVNCRGELETDMLIARSNCLLGLARYDEAYDVAGKVLKMGDEELATLAMQYMAEARMWQSRVPESLEIYVAIEKRLPCRFVREERIRKGIENALAYLEKRLPQTRPF